MFDHRYFGQPGAIDRAERGEPGMRIGLGALRRAGFARDRMGHAAVGLPCGPVRRADDIPKRCTDGGQVLGRGRQLAAFLWLGDIRFGAVERGDLLDEIRLPERATVRDRQPDKKLTVTKSPAA